jgi:hypothetical protein
MNIDGDACLEINGYATRTNGWAALPLGGGYALQDNPSISIRVVFYDTPVSPLDLGLDGLYVLGASQPNLPVCSAPPVSAVTVTANVP